MIAVDTSTLVHLTNGVSSPSTQRFSEALSAQLVILPPVVVTEFLAGP